MTQEEDFKYRVVDYFDSEAAEWFDGDKWVHQRLEEIVDSLNYAERSCGIAMVENERLRAEVERLNKKIEEIAEMDNLRFDKLRQLEAENARLRSALEDIAAIEWHVNFGMVDFEQAQPMVEIARNALKGGAEI